MLHVHAADENLQEELLSKSGF